MSLAVSQYSYGERIFRTAVFQYGVAHPRFERFLMSRFASPEDIFDPQRAENGLISWKRLGATEFTVVPQDGKAEISALLWRAEDLEKILTQAGACWKRIEIAHEKGTRTILAIIPPVAEHGNWNAIETDLKKFNWNRQRVTLPSGETLDVIVTCDEADELRSEEDGKKNFYPF